MTTEEEIISKQTPENLKKALTMYSELLKTPDIFRNDLFGNFTYQFCHVAKHALVYITTLEGKSK